MTYKPPARRPADIDPNVTSGISAGVIAGAMMGGQASSVDAEGEHAFWREHFRDRPYVQPGSAYESLAPAYQHGWESHARYGSSLTGEPARFEDVEPRLRSDWEARHGDDELTWDKAQAAARDAWDRVRDAMLGETPKPSAR